MQNQVKLISKLPTTPETATSTSPRPPGPFMYILSVFPEEWSERRLPNPVLPAAAEYIQKKKKKARN